ncbi:unnamed protein product [Spirodela intermedia]|uniref:Uncharacterized protein n=1 Tax=Spirodela intermedia TaxID=51605 RepID=A0A7I8JML6_SPIIN|nr:unnamed protein product [Spirodela intermedia]CAA6671407.1 unnamed protein product [Spirodela intermedia]
MGAVTAAPPARSGGASSSKTESYANIQAARAVADAVRNQSRAQGMDKMIASASGEVIITNDGATILNKMEVLQPAAKMLVELSRSQDAAAGDGTTTVVVLAGAFLAACQSLLSRGIHPTTISDAIHKSCAKAVDILQSMSVPLELSDRESLVKSAATSLNSKVVSQYSSLLAPLAVDSVLSVVDPARPDLVDLRILKSACQGLVFDKKVSHSAGGPGRVENAKIAVIQFQISPPKTDIEQSIVVSDYTQMDRILKEERNYILGSSRRSRLRAAMDAVTDLSLHYLAKAKILVIKDVERDDIEFVTKTLNCLQLPMSSISGRKAWICRLRGEVSVGDGKIVKITGIKEMGRTTTVLKFLIAGGGAPEIELSRQLGAWSKELRGWKATVSRNLQNPSRGDQRRNQRQEGQITNILEENVVQPLLVSTSAVTLATECVRMILKIDDIVTVR